MVGPVGAAQEPGRHVLRRHEAPAGDRARPAALAARALPRRADRRARPADARSIWELHPRAASEREDITIFLTTHYMDEAEYCDRIAIMDRGPRSSRSTRPRRSRRRSARTACRSAPTTTRRRSPRCASASASRPAIAEGEVTFAVADGEQFVPRLFAELGVADPLGQRRRGPRSTTSSCPTPARRSATPRRPSAATRATRMMQRDGGARPMTRTASPAPHVVARPRPGAQPAQRPARGQDRLAARADPLQSATACGSHRRWSSRCCSCSCSAPGCPALAAAGTDGVDLRTFMFPGMLAMAVLFTAIFSAGSIVWDREFGFLREMLVAPVRRSSIVLGKCLGGATVAQLPGRDRDRAGRPRRRALRRRC